MLFALSGCGSSNTTPIDEEVEIPISIVEVTEDNIVAVATNNGTVELSVNYTGDASAKSSRAVNPTVASYQWSLDGVNYTVGSSVTVEGLVTGTYTFLLTITYIDGSTDTIAIDVLVVSEIVDDSMTGGSATTSGTVTLEASVEDDDSLIVSYVWRLNDEVVGEGSTLTLSGQSAGRHEYILTVTYVDGSTTVVVEVVVVPTAPITPPAGGGTTPPVNTAPTADAGADQNCTALNSTVDLNGTASSDPENDTLSYDWNITVQPVGSNATLSDTTIENPTLTFDTIGIYTVSLIVNDGDFNSTVDTVTVTVITEAPSGYGLVCSPHTGKVWLDRNLGASQVCTAYNDSDCYGDYYQWGRNADGHQASTSGSGGTIVGDVANLDNAGTEFIKNSSSPYDWASVDGNGAIREANWSKTDGSSVCPTGYRVPTETELAAETTEVGVTSNVAAFASFLKLPSAGSRGGSSGALGSQGSYGGLWSASVVGSYSRSLGFVSSDADWGNDGRASGLSVRCLRD